VKYLAYVEETNPAPPESGSGTELGSSFQCCSPSHIGFSVFWALFFFEDLEVSICISESFEGFYSDSN